jgi:hypothetical protein
MSLTLDQFEAHLRGCGYTGAEIASWRRRFRASPDVWREFERLTMRLIGERKKAGAMDILGRVRWERQVEARLEFKVNNSDAPFYARLFALKYPQHNSFFEFRSVGKSCVGAAEINY